MYKNRVAFTEGRGGIREIVDNKKRVEDALEKASLSTSIGSTGRDKEHLLLVPTSTGRRGGSTDTPTLYEKTTYPDDGDDSETDSEESDVSGSDGDDT
eukprot:c14371_g1_i1 orf=333-626(+)